jgi:hypothetical protein
MLRENDHDHTREGTMTTLTAMQRRALAAALQAAKQDAYCKAVGGFAIARMSDGTIDWFPLGQPPNRNGDPDRGAVILAKWRWNHRRWSRIA